MFRRTFFQAIASLAACCGLRVKPNPTKFLSGYAWIQEWTFSEEGAAYMTNHCRLFDQFENDIVLREITNPKVYEVIEHAIKKRTPMIDVLHQLGQIDRGFHI